MREIPSSERLQTSFVSKFSGLEVRGFTPAYTSFDLLNENAALSSANGVFLWCESPLSAHRPSLTDRVQTRVNHSCFKGSCWMFIRTTSNRRNPMNEADCQIRGIVPRWSLAQLLISRWALRNYSYIHEISSWLVRGSRSTHYSETWINRTAGNTKKVWVMKSLSYELCSPFALIMWPP